MGYYSQVTIITNQEGLDKIIQAVERTQFNSQYILNCTSQYKNFVQINFTNIKWYRDAFIDAIKEVVENHNEISFCRIGEDFEDYEEYYNSVLGDLPRAYPVASIDIID